MCIPRRLALGFVATALAVMTTSCGGAGDPQDSLVTYGKKIASSSEQNAIVFDTVIQTTETPRRAYQIKFKTNHQALMSEPNADKDQKAFQINQGNPCENMVHYAILDFSQR
jgi:hypothetical protein